MLNKKVFATKIWWNQRHGWFSKITFNQRARSFTLWHGTGEEHNKNWHKIFTIKPEEGVLAKHVPSSINSCLNENDVQCIKDYFFHRLSIEENNVIDFSKILQKILDHFVLNKFYHEKRNGKATEDKPQDGRSVGAID